MLLVDAGAGLDAGGVALGLLLNELIRGVDLLVHLLLAVKGVDHDEVIVRAADDKGVREGAFQRLRHQTQQPVAHIKAILAVVVLHGNDVGVDQHGRLPQPADGVHPLVGKLDHVVQVRQTGQLVGIEHIVLEQLFVLGKLLRFFHAAGHIQIDNTDQLRPV